MTPIHFICGINDCQAKYRSRFAFSFHQCKKHQTSKKPPGSARITHLEITDSRQRHNAHANDSYWKHCKRMLRQQALQRLVEHISKTITQKPDLTAEEVLVPLRLVIQTLSNTLRINSREHGWIL